ncbi:MAG: GDP-mannose 4,6-dehydratase, partial [Planctomycetales bacterium]
MVLKALEGKPLPLYGDGQQRRDWLHVEDHSSALRTVLTEGVPGQTYHIGGNCEQTNLAVVEMICGIVDRLQADSSGAPARKLIAFVEDRPGHDRRYALDCRKIQDQLGWTPIHTFESSLETTVRWYLKNAGWAERICNEQYRGERLGLSNK